jgi:hypothetical protein
MQSRFMLIAIGDSQGFMAAASIKRAADEARIGDGVMRRAERPLGYEILRRIEHSRDGINLGRFESFLEAERRKNRREPLGEHRFS